MLKVIQIRMQLYFLSDIPLTQLQAELASFLDQSLSQDEQYAKFHQMNCQKLYCFDCAYPIEKDKLYKKGNIYSVTIRTISDELARYFFEQTIHCYTKTIKALTAEVKFIRQRHIEMLYSITPAITKCDGYWRGILSLEKYEERIKVNLLKKWHQFYGEKMEEDFDLFTGLEFLNKVPIVMQYKSIRLLGDKLRLHIAENTRAQTLAQLAVGTGLLEMNSRGAGFCNYRWL